MEGEAPGQAPGQAPLAFIPLPGLPPALEGEEQQQAAGSLPHLQPLPLLHPPDLRAWDGQQQQLQDVSWTQMAQPQLDPSQPAALPPPALGGLSQGLVPAPPCAAFQRLDPAQMAAKLAAAREKNRLAQQRFRERQRAKAQAVEDKVDALAAEVQQMAMENEELSQQNRIYQKVLAVRDAMIETFAALRPPERQLLQLQQQQVQVQLSPPDTAAAADELARAIDELPSVVEMDAAASIADTAAEEQGASASALPSLAPPPAQAAQPQLPRQLLPLSQTVPGWTLAEAHRTGTASSLDGSALRRVESIPPVRDVSVKEQVMAMTDPEQLLDYYREWQAELSAAYVAAEATGFDAESVAEVEAVQDRMAQVWWYVGEMKPPFLSFLTHAALPENSAQCRLWRDIAAVVFPQMGEGQRVVLRRAWNRYSKNLAKIAAGVSSWAKKLQAYAVQPPEGLVDNARRAVELTEITCRIGSAVQDEYVASMEFIAEQAATTNNVQKAHMNHMAMPWMPDLIAINFHILCMDQQQRGRGAMLPGMPPAEALPEPTAASAAQDSSAAASRAPEAGP